MKKMLRNSLVAAAMTVPVLAFAAVGAAGGLLGTVHDFATNAGYLATQTDGAGVTTIGANSVGLCTYCHTPHSALSTTLLWNHKLSTNTFTWDDAATQAGTVYATMAPTYKGTSVKCLSCHDGSVAVGDVALYNDKTAAVYNTFVVPAGYTRVGGAGSMAGNHPVAMPYPFGQVANTYNSKATGANAVLTEFVTNPVNQNSTTVKLYNDTGTLITQGAVAAKSGIECSSCHDVHNKASVDDMLLRGKIAGSTAADGYLCLQCHIK